MNYLFYLLELQFYNLKSKRNTCLFEVCISAGYYLCVCLIFGFQIFLSSSFSVMTHLVKVVPCRTVAQAMKAFQVNSKFSFLNENNAKHTFLAKTSTKHRTLESYEYKISYSSLEKHAHTHAHSHTYIHVHVLTHAHTQM